MAPSLEPKLKLKSKERRQNLSDSLEFLYLKPCFCTVLPCLEKGTAVGASAIWRNPAELRVGIEETLQ